MAIYATVIASGAAGTANEPSMHDAVDVKGMAPLRWNQSLKFTVTLVRTLSRCPSQTSRNSMNVTVNGQDVQAQGEYHDTFSHFLRNARQRDKIFLNLIERFLSEAIEIARTEVVVNLA